jgi:hypothetical protein
MRETFTPVDPRFVYSICAFRQFHFLIFSRCGGANDGFMLFRQNFNPLQLSQTHALKQRGYGGALIVTGNWQ